MNFFEQENRYKYIEDPEIKINHLPIINRNIEKHIFSDMELWRPRYYLETIGTNDEKTINKNLYSSGPYWDYKNKKTIYQIKKWGHKKNKPPLKKVNSDLRIRFFGLLEQ